MKLQYKIAFFLLSVTVFVLLGVVILNRFRQPAHTTVSANSVQVNFSLIRQAEQPLQLLHSPLQLQRSTLTRFGQLSFRLRPDAPKQLLALADDRFITIIPNQEHRSKISLRSKTSDFFLRDLYVEKSVTVGWRANRPDHFKVVFENRSEDQRNSVSANFSVGDTLILNAADISFIDKKNQVIKKFAANTAKEIRLPVAAATATVTVNADFGNLALELALASVPQTELEILKNLPVSGVNYAEKEYNSAGPADSESSLVGGFIKIATRQDTIKLGRAQHVIVNPDAGWFYLRASGGHLATTGLYVAESVKTGSRGQPGSEKIPSLLDRLMESNLWKAIYGILVLVFSYLAAFTDWVSLRNKLKEPTH